MVDDRGLCARHSAVRCTMHGFPSNEWLMLRGVGRWRGVIPEAAIFTRSKWGANVRVASFAPALIPGAINRSSQISLHLHEKSQKLIDLCRT